MNNPQRPTDAGCEFVAGSTWRDEDCRAASIEVVGGHYIAALAYGSTEAEAEQRRVAILAALSVSGGDAAELRKWPDIGQDPMKGSRPVDRYETSAAACRAAYVQQQTHVPDQTALVWRWHLGTLLEQHIRLKSILANKRDAAELAAADMRERAAQTAGSFHMRQGSNDLADARTKDWIAAAIRALPLAKQEQS